MANETDKVAEATAVTMSVASTDPTTQAATITDGGTVNVTFTAGAFSAGDSLFAVTPGGTMSGSVPSVDGGYYTAKLTARDADKNPIKDLDVTKMVFAANNSAITITNPAVNNGDGTYTVTYTSTLADQQADGTAIPGVTPLTASVTYDGSAKVADASGNTDPSIHFVPGEPNPGPIVCTDTSKVGTNFTVTSNAETVGTTVVLKAYVTDKNCNPIDGVPVTFKADNNGQLLGIDSSLGTAMTGTTFPTQTAVVATDPGNAWVDMTSYIPGDVTVHATIDVNGTPADLNGGTAATASPQTVTFTAGPPVINPSCQPPNTVGTNISAVSPVTMPSTSKVSVLVTDEYCNPLPDVPVNFTINNKGTLSSATATSGDGTNGTTLGVATVQAADTQVEWVTVEATIPSSDQPTTPVKGTSTRSGDGSGADVQFLAVGTPAIQTPGAGDTVVTATPPISGTGAVPGDTITVNDANGNPIPGCDPVTSNADGTWTCTPTSPLITGNGPTDVTLMPVQTDPQGNFTNGPSVTFTVNTTPPVITNPPAGTTVVTATPKIDGTGGVPGGTVKVVDDNGNPVPGCNPATVNPDGTWTCTPTAPGLPDGSNKLTPVITDKDGNTLPGAPVQITVNTTPPSINPMKPTNNNQPKITGKGTVPGDTITVHDGDGSTVCTATVQPDGTWSCTPSKPLPDGTHKLTAVETDKGGNTGTPSAPQSVLIDTSVPTAPVPDPTTGGTITGSAQPGMRIQITVPDANGNPVAVPGCTNVVADGNGRFSCNPATPLAAGTVVTLRAFNAVGTGSLPATVTVGAVPVAVQTGGDTESNFGAVAAGILGLIGVLVAIVAIRRRQKFAG